MKSMLVPALVLASGISLATTACSKNANSGDTNPAATDTAAALDATTPATDTTATNSPAAQFLTEAMKGDNSEARVGKLAQEKGSSQAVKDFGKMLADDHGQHKDMVAKIATAMYVSTTDETTPEADTVYKKLQGLGGKDFDKEFASAMVEDHKKDIDKYQKEASSSDPAPVVDLAKQTLPTLDKHLKTAQSLNK